MSTIKLPAASGGGSISLKGPSSAGSDTDFLDTSGNLTVTGTSTLTGNVTGGGDIISSTGYYQTNSSTERFSLTHDGANCYLENQIGSFYVKSVDNANTLEVGNGAVTLNSANLVIGTAGKGIDFSATSDATGKSSELLDDYEEGTWTPAIGYQNSSGLTISTNSASGKYTKIGNVIYVLGYINWTVSGTPVADNIYISGLPAATDTGEISAGNTRFIGNISLHNTNAQDVTHQVEPYGTTGANIILESEKGNRADNIGAGSGMYAKVQYWYFTN